MKFILAMVSALFAITSTQLFAADAKELTVEQSIRINVVGRRDRLGPEVLRTIEHSERATAARCRGLSCQDPPQHQSKEQLRLADLGPRRGPLGSPHRRSTSPPRRLGEERVQPSEQPYVGRHVFRLGVDTDLFRVADVGRTSGRN